MNGSPKGYFRSSSGILQGDHLSPLLFVFVVEALQALLDKANEVGIPMGFTIDRLVVVVNHLQFAEIQLSSMDLL